MVMWNEHGFTGYVRASALQAPAVSYGLLAESLEYQSPELVVLLCDNIFNEYDYPWMHPRDFISETLDEIVGSDKLSNILKKAIVG